MAQTKKFPLTDPTGEKAAKKSRTSTSNGKSKIKASAEKIASTAQNVADKVNGVATNVRTVTNAVGTIGNAVGNVAESIGIKSQGKTSYQLREHDAYGGLKLPTFNPQELMATDLYTVSSALSRTTKTNADLACEAIEEQRQTVRIAVANLDLNTDILRAGVKSEKMVQSGIDYGISKVDTDTKLINFEESLVKNEIAATKLDQTREKLTHEQVTLEALQNETDQRRRYWQAKYQLGESRIKDVQMAQLKLDAKIGAIDVDASTIE